MVVYRRYYALCERMSGLWFTIETSPSDRGSSGSVLTRGIKARQSTTFFVTTMLHSLDYTQGSARSCKVLTIEHDRGVGASTILISTLNPGLIAGAMFNCPDRVATRLNPNHLHCLLGSLPILRYWAFCLTLCPTSCLSSCRGIQDKLAVPLTGPHCSNHAVKLARSWKPRGLLLAFGTSSTQSLLEQERSV